MSMGNEHIFVPKQQVFSRKIFAIFGLCAVVLIVAMLVQMRMTWQRERLRSIRSDMHDAVNVVTNELQGFSPRETVIAPMSELLQSATETD